MTHPHIQPLATPFGQPLGPIIGKVGLKVQEERSYEGERQEKGERGEVGTPTDGQIQVVWLKVIARPGLMCDHLFESIS